MDRPKIYYKPPVKSAQRGVFPVNFSNFNDKYQRRIERKYQNITNPNAPHAQNRGIGFAPSKPKPFPIYEKEKRLETLSVNEIDSAVKTLLC